MIVNHAQVMAIEGGVLTGYSGSMVAFCDLFDANLIRNAGYDGPFAKIDIFTDNPEEAITIELCGESAERVLEAYGCLQST